MPGSHGKHTYKHIPVFSNYLFFLNTGETVYWGIFGGIRANDSEKEKNGKQ